GKGDAGVDENAGSRLAIDGGVGVSAGEDGATGVGEDRAKIEAGGEGGEQDAVGIITREANGGGVVAGARPVVTAIESHGHSCRDEAVDKSLAGKIIRAERTAGGQDRPGKNRDIGGTRRRATGAAGNGQ